MKIRSTRKHDITDKKKIIIKQVFRWIIFFLQNDAIWKKLVLKIKYNTIILETKERNIK